ncbi:MerR family transcriptional regulator [Zhihengliuella alba]|uniref:MerR family transcriptional regulator n=1 Tax=Zhihengliuella alba TaxID=547018 RepID=A0ABP7DVS4_9MICC
MQIGELAEAVGLSLRTIRHYDDVGLLPASRTEGGYRVYTDEDLRRMLVIRTLKPLGFSLEELRTALNCLDDARSGTPEAQEQLAALVEQIRERRDQMEVNLRRADELLGDLDHRRDG